jgi:hypothetical protein
MGRHYFSRCRRILSTAYHRILPLGAYIATDVPRYVKMEL